MESVKIRGAELTINRKFGSRNEPIDIIVSAVRYPRHSEDHFGIKVYFKRGGFIAFSNNDKTRKEAKKTLRSLIS